MNERTILSLQLTCDTDGSAAKPIDETSNNGARHEVNTAKEASNPGHGAGIRVKISEGNCKICLRTDRLSLAERS